MSCLHLLYERKDIRGLNNIPWTICQRAFFSNHCRPFNKQGQEGYELDFCFPFLFYMLLLSHLFTWLYFHTLQSVFNFLSILSALLAVRGGSKLEKKVRRNEERRTGRKRRARCTPLRSKAQPHCEAVQWSTALKALREPPTTPRHFLYCPRPLLIPWKLTDNTVGR